MAIGRYDSPAQAQFINTYIPVPFDEIVAAGQARQQQYNAGLAGFEQAQADAEQLGYIPGSVDEEYITGTVLPTFQELADEYATQDFSDPNVLREINKRVRTLDRKYISDIQKSAQAHQQYLQDLRKSELQFGRTPGLNQFDAAKFDSRRGIFQERVERPLDFGATAEGYFNQLRDTFLGMSEQGVLSQGVTENMISDVAQANLGEFMSTPEGNQAIRIMRAQGHQGSDAEIAYDVLLSRGQEFIRKNISFAPQHVLRGSGNENKGVRLYNSPEFLLEEQSFEKEFVKFNKAFKRRKEVEEQVSEIDAEIASLDRMYSSGKITKEDKDRQTSNLQTLKDSQEAEVYAINYHFDRFAEEYHNKAGTRPEEFPRKLVDKLASQGVGTALEYSQQLEAAMEEYLNGERNYANLGTAYNQIHGGVSFRDLPLTFNQKTKLRQAVESIEEEYKAFKKAKTSYIEDQWETLDKGITKSTKLLPATDAGDASGSKIQIPGTNDWVFNPLSNVFSTYQNNPESLDLRRITGDILSEKDLEKDRELIQETINSGGTLDFEAAGTFDPKSPFVTFVLKDNEGNRIDNFQASVQLPTQINAIAQTFALVGDVDNALKFQNPEYSQGIAKQFEKGVKPDTASFNILEDELSLRKVGKGYQVYNNGILVNSKDGNPLTVSDSPQAIENFVYEVYKQTIASRRASLATTPPTN